MKDIKNIFHEIDSRGRSTVSPNVRGANNIISSHFYYRDNFNIVHLIPNNPTPAFHPPLNQHCIEA